MSVRLGTWGYFLILILVGLLILYGLYTLVGDLFWLWLLYII